MVTLKEIADICHVSTATVSNVINGKSKASKKTEQRILKVIAETGYRPNAMAKGLRTRRSHTIALISEDIGIFTTPRLISGIMRSSEQNGYRVVLYNLRLYDRWSDTWYNEEQVWHTVLDPVLQNVLAASADGVIYLAGHARKIPCFPLASAIPAVMCYAYSTETSIPSVVINDEAGAEEIVTYLIDRGHRRIAFIGGVKDNLHTIHRLAGYRKALETHGIPYDEQLTAYGNWSREDACAAAKSVCKPDVTAVFSCSDQMAGGIYDMLEERGQQAGRDLSVVGYDNDSVSGFFRPGLTTMELPLYEIGEKTAELLVKRLTEPEIDPWKPKEQLVVPVSCHLVERDSVADLR